MFTIESAQVTPQILSLFDFNGPTMPRAFSVLEGINRGQILVDDPLRPTRAVVRDGMFGTLYFGEQVDHGLLTALVERFRAIGEVGIGCWLDDPLKEILPDGPDYDGRSLYFTERRQAEPRPYTLSTDYRLVVRDRELFPQSPDYASTLESFGSLEAVMQHTVGVAVLHGDELACEAATGAPTRGWIEVGVTTIEPYRQRGLAYLACKRLIELCEARGYSTWWDCAVQNTASVRLARSLGYHSEREYRYVWWRPNT